MYGWVYLAVVLDLFSRKVVGWLLSVSIADVESHASENGFSRPAKDA